MDERHVEILVEGEIQNIGLAFQVMRIAEKLNICGYTKYTDANSIKIIAEGNKTSLDEFLNWCKTDMPETCNLHIKMTPNKLKGFKKFTLINY